MSSKPRPRPKAVLFDLGKVILHFNFEPAFARLARRTALSEKDIEDFFVSSGLEVLYDGGKISSRRFYGEVRKGLRLRMDYRSFRSAWNRIFTPNLPVIRLVRRLKARGLRLVLVSNTNAMHYAYIRSRYRILRSLDRHVLSFRERTRKPDARIYRTAARACGARPSDIFYIDDREDLTSAARELGFRVFTYKKNTPELERALRREGLL